MDLFIYAKPGPKSEELQAVLECSLSHWDKNYFSNLDELMATLKRPLISSRVVILLVVNGAEEMNQLLGIKETLSRFDSVLIISGEMENLKSRSHDLAARLVLPSDLPPAHIQAALCKIADRAEQRTSLSWA